MKSNLIGILFILTTTNIAFGQNKVTEKKYQTYNGNIGKWEIQELEQTNYDEEERAVLWNIYRRDLDTDSLINERRIENVYSTEERQQTEYRWDKSSNQLMPLSLQIWEYNEAGCPTNSTYRALEGSAASNDNLKKIKYQYKLDAPPCTLAEEVYSIYIPELHTDFVDNNRVVYTYENDGKTEKKEIFILILSTQVWNLAQVQEREYNDAGQLLAQKTETINGLKSDFTWKYNEAGRVVSIEANQYENDVLKSHRLTTTDYELDEQGFVIEKTVTEIEANTKREYSYENYCDGLVQVEKELDNGTLAFNETHFKYLHGTDCEIFEEKLDLFLYPNPTNGKVTLQSDLFTAVSAQVQIFNMAGQQLRTFQMPERTNTVEIAVDDLPVGSYVVRVISEENSVTEQLIVAPF